MTRRRHGRSSGHIECSPSLLSSADVLRNVRLPSLERSGAHDVQREGEVNTTNDQEDEVAQLRDLVVVHLGDTQSWGDLLPAQACVRHEDDHAHQVEHGPCRLLEHLVLQLVDVPYWNGLYGLVLGPEQIEGQDSGEVDEITRWADPVWVGGTETELEQVNGHETHQCKSGDGQVELSGFDAKVQFQVPSAFQSNENVQKSSQQNVFLHNVCRQSKSSPIQTHIEITISVEVIGWARPFAAWGCGSKKKSAHSKRMMEG